MNDYELYIEELELRLADGIKTMETDLIIAELKEIAEHDKACRELDKQWPLIWC